MKVLILMRHGQAEWNSDSDAQRTLTELGQRQVIDTANALLQAGFVPQQLLCSPLVRAEQSAQLAGNILGLSPNSNSLLDGRLSAAGLLSFAYEQLEHTTGLMLVGHNPTMSLAAGLLSGAYISFRPGDCAVFDVTHTETPKILFRGI